MRTPTRFSKSPAKGAREVLRRRRATRGLPSKDTLADVRRFQERNYRHARRAPATGGGLLGQEDGGHALVERLYPTIVKSVRGRLPRRTSEEDLVQAVFAKIF